MIPLAAMFKDLSLTQGELRFLLDLDPYDMTLNNSLPFPPQVEPLQCDPSSSHVQERAPDPG